MEIKEISEGKETFMPLLLEGDEQEDMVWRYLWRGRLYAGYEAGALVAVCVVTEEDGSTVEIKNLAVHRDFRRRGCGRRMLLHVESAWPGLMLGTGETPSTLLFYHKCGYSYSHTIKDFFTDNYSSPIIEEGVRLRDMVYLHKKP